MNKDVEYINGFKWVRRWVKVRGEVVPKWEIVNFKKEL